MVARSLSVVVPAYNEESRLPALLERLRADEHELFAPAGLRVDEILVVDDGSTDGTRRLTEERALQDDRLSVIGFDRNRGKGAAVRAGMLAAVGERILVTDVDMSASLEQTAALSAALDRGADVAIGSRGHPDAAILVHQRFPRRQLGKTFNTLFRGLTGLPFRDTQCGFKLFRQPAGRLLMERQRIAGFAYDAELCLNATRLNLHVVEVPVVWSNSGESHVRLVRSSARMAVDLCRIAWWARAGGD
jgi:glycosyltransferase involved in cell wall biosynthesis